MTVIPSMKRWPSLDFCNQLYLKQEQTHTALPPHLDFKVGVFDVYFFRFLWLTPVGFGAFCIPLPIT